MTDQKCIICQTNTTEHRHSSEHDHTFYSCKRCGEFITKRNSCSLDNSDKSMLSHLEKILGKEFGLELFSMEHNNKLGNIIEVMKAEINDAKFIICDLSHGNRCAYWEAGYAEGQKKKVIYICNEIVFNKAENGDINEKGKIHFDIKQTRIIKFNFLNPENKNFKIEIESAIKASGLNF